jgi:hypothetical protein
MEVFTTLVVPDITPVGTAGLPPSSSLTVKVIGLALPA